jgi:hypothetical protein
MQTPATAKESTMAKRRSLQPWPETVWHSSGRVGRSSSLRVIRQHLQSCVDDGSVAHLRDFKPDGEDWWFGFDAAWRTDDGDRIKARLQLAPDMTFVRRRKLSRADLETQDVDVDLYWSLTAEADRPWNLNWPSPLGMFGDQRTYDWVTGKMPLRDYSGFNAEALQPAFVRQSFEELSTCPWYITVITHDRTPLHQAATCKEDSLAKMVPPSLQGRVLEFRFFGDQDQVVNTEGVLPESRLRLKWGGSLILPTRPRHDEWALADCIIRRPPGADMEQMLKETAEAVTRYAELRPHYCDRARSGVENLRTSWVLPEIELAPKRVLLEKQQAVEEVERLGRVIESLRAVLAAERRHGQELLQAKEQAEEGLKELLESPLVQGASEARQQAEAALQLVEEADDLTERLTAEVGYLRRQLALVPGRSYDEPVPEPQDGPKSWAELLALAPELLPGIRILADVAEPLDKLDRHPKTKTWLRRTWTALEAFQAYTEAKKSQGAEVLPHMLAYLRWELAEVVFPESWYAAGEAAVLRRDPKYAAMRTFAVPELGPVFMGEHVRVGGNRPPAPRMHVYDDTTGPTGQILVGYIGPHLPNGSPRD